MCMGYPDRVQAKYRPLTPLDLREQSIRYLDDVVVPYAKAQKQSLQTTGRMPPREVLVTTEQATTIRALLQNQSVVAIPTEEPLRWYGLTFTVA